ncbi:MAG: hypothetical protein ACRDBM_00555 [Sporomusa sp.]
MKVVQTGYDTPKEILKFPDHYVGLAVMVDDTGITADEYGKKIVPAGTIVGGTTGAILDTLDGLVTKKNDASAEGVLIRDVDVTYGAAPGTMLIHAFVNTDKLPEAPAAAAVTALKQITFLK